MTTLLKAKSLKGCPHNMLKIGQDGIKQAEQEQTRRNGRNRCKGKPFVAEYVHKTLSDRIK